MVLSGIIVNSGSGLLFEIGLIIIIATLFIYIARLLKQPLIPAYVLAGIILGPIGFGLIDDMSFIEVLSEIGIIFLLFIVGLEINFSKLRKVGKVSAIGGLIQVILTFAAGFAVSEYLLGLPTLTSVYVGLIVAFSSTMVVIKLLSDRDKLNTIHGRIVIGFLLVQDFLVIFALSFLSSLKEFSILTILLIIFKVILVLGLAAFLNKFVIYRIFKFAAKSAEVLFLLSLTVCFLFVILAYVLGFSIAIGAFIGGVILANLPYHFNIIGHVSPLKDFFSIIFFVSLGMQLVFTNFVGMLKPMFILLALVIILKPLIILFILSFFGYGKRISFLVAISLAQVSEFALILVTEGKNIIGTDMFSLTIVLAVISISFTAYLIKYEEKFYTWISKNLKFIDKFSKNHDELSYRGKGHKHRVIMFGCNIMGSVILKNLGISMNNFLVIDSNPEIINKLIRAEVPCMYGDMGNIEILKRMKLKQTRLVVSTIRHEEDNLRLLNYMKHQNKKITVVLTASTIHDALELYEAGADYVIVPMVTTGERISVLLEKFLKKRRSMDNFRARHLKHLLELNSRF